MREDPVRKAIADALSELLEWQVSPYMLGDPTPPAAHVFPARLEYHKAFQDGLNYRTMTLQVFVSDDAGDIGAQMLLDEYLEEGGPREVKALIERDDTLGGAVDDVTVLDSSGYRRYVTPSRPLVLGAEWTLRVLLPGN